MDVADRFSDRVDNYVKYRPHYPKEIISILKEEKLLNEKSVIADIGAGTGILSKPFLENGNEVMGVEPNIQMMEAAKKYLKKYSKFTPVLATAENIPMADNSVDLIVIGQALHWFDLSKARIEFRRILKENGHVVG